MADTISSSSNLTVTLEYTNSDSETKTASFKIPNYSTYQATEETIKQQVGTALNQGLFVNADDGTALDSDSILTASTTNQTIRNLDIGWDD